ncbi:hypothetical protein ACT4UM_12115 [Bacillus sp. SS-TM]
MPLGVGVVAFPVATVKLFLTLPFASAEAATTKDQLIVDTQLNKMDYYQDGRVKNPNDNSALNNNFFIVILLLLS